jgi:hypothetical protein
MEDRFDFEAVGAKFLQVKKELPIIMANQAQNYFLDSWKQQGFNGSAWAVPKRRIEGSQEWIYPKFKGLSRRVKITLVASGALRRAVSNSIRLATFDLTELVVPLVYAEAHNDGNPKGNVPRRQFIGQTEKLTEMQLAKIDFYIDKIWQG